MADTQVAAPAAIPDFPQPAVFCLEIPLYEKFRFAAEIEEAVVDLMVLRYRLLQFDSHCVECGKNSTFHCQAVFNSEVTLRDLASNGHWEREATCSREKRHRMYFYFEMAAGFVTKVGQSPALVELHLPEVQRYRSALGQDYADLARAIGLATHGIGVGSFVYLRRVFENLIEEARAASVAAGQHQDANFKDKRMHEKIGMLSGQLPEFLVENSTIYSILSVGIHSLTEDRCLEVFPIMRTGIELILDQKLERLERAKKIAEATKLIESARQQVGRTAGRPA